MKRRSLLLGALTASGALVVGWGALPPRSRLGTSARLPAADGTIGLNGWLRIAPDGLVHLVMPRSEMGQGVHTALAMLVAEELDVPLSMVRLDAAGPDRIHGNVALLVASLPLHPSAIDTESPDLAVRGSRWIVSKLGTELGLVVTGGSSSVADAWDVLRLAAATARAQLLGAASLQWKLPVDDLEVERGIISHGSGQSAHFGEFARVAAA
ncbi:MAG: molybdopterin cofactor-binding domain-containing protein, partial [Rhizobacter sp.]